ncbi:MAG: ribonuclease P protein component [Candidatus Chisholmbacteria bacterium]|nr:ribonuclease P protein component [Candidatus Chisholmbacteria bacterium]
MLPKKHRLPGKIISSIKKGGRKFFTPLAMTLATKSSLPTLRATISVSSKVSSLATKRNRLKRMFRHALFHHHSLFPPGFDVVIIPKKASQEASFSQIKKDMAALIHMLSNR